MAPPAPPRRGAAVEHPDRAQRREPLCAPRLLVLAVGGERDHDRRRAGAHHLERGVVAALAHRGAGLAKLGAEVGDRAHELDPGVAAARRSSSGQRSAGNRGPAISRIGRRARAARGRRSRRAAAARQPGRRRPRPARGRCAAVRGRPVAARRRTRCDGRGRAAVDRGSNESSRRAKAGSECTRTRSNQRLAVAAARSSWRRWRSPRETRMSRRLQATSGRGRPARARRSSSGRSSAANFLRPNGNSSITQRPRPDLLERGEDPPAFAARRCARPRPRPSAATSAPSAPMLSGGSETTRTPAGNGASGGIVPPLSRVTSKRSESASHERERTGEVAEAERVLAVDEQRRAVGSRGHLRGGGQRGVGLGQQIREALDAAGAHPGDRPQAALGQQRGGDVPAQRPRRRAPRRPPRSRPGPPARGRARPRRESSPIRRR